MTEQLQFDELVEGVEAWDRRRRVMVVAGHELDAHGLDHTLRHLGWTSRICAPSRTDELASALRSFRPGIVLYDVGSGVTSGSGTDLVRTLATPDVAVVVLTSERRRLVLAEYLVAGAAGWIARSASVDEIDAALDDVASGVSILGRQQRAALLHELRNDRERRSRFQDLFQQLSEREASVLVALGDGLSAAEIAKKHYVSLATVRSQIRAVLVKLGVNSQLAAVAIATEHRHLLPRDGEEIRERRRVTTSPPAATPRSAVGSVTHIA